MKISKTILAVIGTAVIASGLISQNANAIPINGSIGFDGTGTGTGGVAGGTLTFNPGLTVGARTGDYLLALGAFPAGPAGVNFAPISWTGNGASAVLTPGAQLEWTFAFGGTTMSFTLQALSNATINQGVVTLAGSGILTMTGAVNRDPTFGTFSVQGTGTGFTFAIVQASNTGAGQGVPDGGTTIALFGIGMIGLEVLRRKLLTA